MKNKLIRSFTRTLALFLAIISIWMLTPITTSAASANTYLIKLYNTGQYMMSNGTYFRSGANAKSSIFFKVEKGSLIDPGAYPGKNVNSFQWKAIEFRTYTGKAVKYFAPSSKLSKAPSSYLATLIRVTKDNTSLRTMPQDANSKVVTTYSKGTILHAVGVTENQYGNHWYVIKLEGDSKLYYMWSGNVNRVYTTSGNIFLEVDKVFQSTNYTCSAASALAVLRYHNTALTVKDTTLQSKTNYSAGGIRNVLNSYLGSGTYVSKGFSSLGEFEKAIRQSLAQGSPVVGLVRFPNEFFSYKSDGHFVVISGIYSSGGKTWVRVVDSFANRGKTTQYSNKNTGIVNIPLEVLYDYGAYRSHNLVYNP